MLDLKLAIVMAGLLAVGANVPASDGPAGETTATLLARFVGLGATGVVAAIAWRMIDVFGKAISRNTDAVDRMREHCSAKNGEAPERRN